MAADANSASARRSRSKAQGRSGSLRRALVALLALTLVAGPALGQTRDQRFNAGDKALRGLANILTGVMAFPGEIYKNWNDGGPGMGLTVGVAMGAGMIVARELVGVFELVTSPAPWPKRDFSPMLQPPYTWEYFKN